MSALIKYDTACRAIAEARTVDEVKDIRDQSVALAAYARQAKNRDLEADAVEIRMRATRRLDQLRQAQKEAVGLNKGLSGSVITGSKKNPVKDSRPTLASQGIDKNLAHKARTLGELSDKGFEKIVADARDAVTRAVKTVVRAADIEQSRDKYEIRAGSGGTVADLAALASSGQRFAVIYADPPWGFTAYSGKGKQRSAERHYDIASLDDIKAVPVADLAADDCALILWCVMPELPGALEVIQAWGFKYKTCSFAWVKQNRNGAGIFTGMGYWTRSNAELCLLATRGSPKRLAKDVPQVILSPVGEHSRKPEEARTRIQRLLAGPYLELFGRRAVDGWTVWGNEIAAPIRGAADLAAYDPEDDFAKSIDESYRVIRERIANGGPGWNPK